MRVEFMTPHTVPKKDVLPTNQPQTLIPSVTKFLLENL